MQNPLLNESTNQNHNLWMNQIKVRSTLMRFEPDMEVLNVDVLVRSRLPLTPEQKSFFSRGFWRERNGPLLNIHHDGLAFFSKVCLIKQCRAVPKSEG